MPSYTFFFAVETNLSFWWDWEKISQKSVPSHMFLRCGDYLKFLMGLRKISTKICAQIHVFSLWRLTWVFDGTWKNFHKKVCPVTRFFAVETILSFFAVETNLSFWWDWEKFLQKSVPSHTFLRCGDYLKFLRGLGKFRQKDVTSYTFVRCRDHLKCLSGLGKFRQKVVTSYTFFFAVQTILSFGWDLEKFRQK